jgi:hypothetical protein
MSDQSDRNRSTEATSAGASNNILSIWAIVAGLHKMKLVNEAELHMVRP